VPVPMGWGWRGRVAGIVFEAPAEALIPGERPNRPIGNAGGDAEKRASVRTNSMWAGR
jgi:hypothetical protein